MLPLLSSGTKNCTGNGNEFNDQCTFTCDEGYERKGSSVRTCQADGTWSGTAASCEGTLKHNNFVISHKGFGLTWRCQQVMCLVSNTFLVIQ